MKEQINLREAYEEKYGFSDPEDLAYKSGKGPSHELIDIMSDMKDEPGWMREIRHKAFDHFLERPMPQWIAPEILNNIDFNDFYYYLKPKGEITKNWDEVDENIKRTFEKLGVPEAETKFLAGVTSTYEGEAVQHSLIKELEDQGVIFCDFGTGLKEHPEIVKKYFGTVVPYSDNKFAALNTAFHSGGSFLFVPRGVKLSMPVQNYFRMNANESGQFERTLIIAEEGSKAVYQEGCSAAGLLEIGLHAAIVELVALENSRIEYLTLQNWSDKVINLVTKRGVAYKNAEIFWSDFNGGAGLTAKYPGIYLLEEGAKANVVSMAFAGSNQYQDTGAKVIHAASNTSSSITSKSVAISGGRVAYRGLVKVEKKVKNIKSKVVCDALLFPEGRSDTYPYIDNDSGDNINIEHEATVSKISEDELFYLQTRGYTEEQARSTIVNGFFEEFAKTLPMEYAVEFNRLIELEMEGSVG